MNDDRVAVLDACAMCLQVWHVAHLRVSEQAPWFGLLLCADCYWYVEELAKEIDA